MSWFFSRRVKISPDFHEAVRTQEVADQIAEIASGDASSDEITIHGSLYRVKVIPRDSESENRGHLTEAGG